MRRVLAAVSLLALSILTPAVLPGPQSLIAQEGRQEGQPGDYYWQLARHGEVLSDIRVENALVLLLDDEVLTSTTGGRLLYGSSQVMEYLDAIGTDEVPLLLRAAGYPSPRDDLQQSRPCRVWTPQDEDGLEQRQAVASSLGEDLARVLGDLDIEAVACELTANFDEADVLVWSFGQDVVVSEHYDVAADSFLVRAGEASGDEIDAPGIEMTPPVVGSGGLLDSQP